ALHGIVIRVVPVPDIAGKQFADLIVVIALPSRHVCLEPAVDLRLVHLSHLQGTSLPGTSPAPRPGRMTGPTARGCPATQTSVNARGASRPIRCPRSPNGDRPTPQPPLCAATGSSTGGRARTDQPVVPLAAHDAPGCNIWSICTCSGVAVSRGYPAV